MERYEPEMVDGFVVDEMRWVFLVYIKQIFKKICYRILSLFVPNRSTFFARFKAETQKNK